MCFSISKKAVFVDCWILSTLRVVKDICAQTNVAPQAARHGVPFPHFVDCVNAHRILVDWSDDVNKKTLTMTRTMTTHIASGPVVMSDGVMTP